MAISSPGVGSGLDVNSLVTQLVAAERAPGDQRFARVESTTQTKISALGALRSALSGLESVLDKFKAAGSALGRKATIVGDAGFSATAGTSAAIGSYRIQVERLATAHKLQSAAAPATTQIGHGTLTLQVGDGTPLDVTIEAGKGTLSDIRDAINKAAGGNGITATVVRGDAGDVLTLASTKVGTAGALTITHSGGDGGLSVLATAGGTLTTAVAATDAQVIIDGVTRTASGNTLTDAIDGITLTLTKAKPGEAFTVDVAADPSPIKISLLSLVSAYNVALSQARTQGAAGGEGKVAGPLSGDSAPRSIAQSLRGAVGTHYAELAALGLKTAVDGSLTLDGAKFDAAITASPDAVKSLLGDNSALGSRLRGMVKSYAGQNGMLENRTDALNDRMKALKREREAFDSRISRVEQAYRRQFTALDGLMSKMQTTSSYLSQQIAALPKPQS